ncbi:hypothetical protein EV714DRAFT_204208 [Schizophyllum commune]
MSFEPSDFTIFNATCPMTGTSNALEVIGLIQTYEARHNDDQTIARIEWAWGLPRGGFSYYLFSPPNVIYLNEGVAQLYCVGHFLLLPTYKTYLDGMHFMQRAAFKDRDQTDRSPRRPLTALSPPNKLYRYVFVSLTDVGRELQNKLQFQSQTDEDWNWGVNPVTGKALPKRSKSYPVVEAHSHPVSMSWFARDMIHRIGKRAPDVELSPWRQCLESLLTHWGVGTSAHVEAPQWFVDDDDKGADDKTLYGSEATGYWPILEPRTEHRLPKYASSDGTDDSHYSVRVPNWLSEVMRPEIKPSRIPKLAQLSTKGSRVQQLANVGNGEYSSSPCRKVHESAWQRREPPAWLKRARNVPSRSFTSSDWAMFYYGVSLEATRAPPREKRRTYASRIPRLTRPSRRAI